MHREDCFDYGYKEIQEHLPTAEQIQRQIALAEEEYKKQLAVKE